MDLGNILFALTLTLLAGLSTGLGSIFAFVIKKPSARFFSISLGFSAGVMLYVSFIEIFNKAKIFLIDSLGDIHGSCVTVAAFFVGVLLIALIEKFIPNPDDPQLVIKEQGINENPDKENLPKLVHMGKMAALAITIHNFPEGMATFASALNSPSLGIAIAIAIAIHNIPEGVAVSLPIYYATGDRKKAFRISFLSGLAEPIGALAGFLILLPLFNGITFGILYAMVAGIMVYLSLNELLPTAIEYGGGSLPIYGLVSGMGVMAISLLLFLF